MSTASDATAAGPSPSDIISYIGIPLAVLGVIPIFYTTISALINYRAVRSALKRSGLHGTIHSSLLSGIVEVELPRWRLTPLDRNEPGYWRVEARPLQIPGGSWTILEWNKIITSKRTYRLQYHDELRTPQADVDMGELLGFLMDRGAVPDAKGLHMLRLAGLWTPVGTTLLWSPSRREWALRVARPDDADGILSLAMKWDSSWDQPSSGTLPTGCMRVHDLNALSKAPQDASATTSGQTMAFTDENKLTTKTESDAAIATSEDEKNSLLIEQTDSTPLGETHADHTPESSLNTSKNLASKDARVRSSSSGSHGHAGRDSAAEPSSTPKNAHELSEAGPIEADSIRFRIVQSNGMLSIEDPFYERNKDILPSKPSIKHLQGMSSRLWLPAAATVLSHVRGSPMWMCEIPKEIIMTAQVDSLPCGIIELCGIMKASETPEWATTYNTGEWGREQHARFMISASRSHAESRLPPDQRAAARLLREAEERNSFHRSHMEQRQREQDRQRLREQEALRSSRLNTNIVSSFALARLLQERDEACRDAKLEDVVEDTIYRSIQDAAFAHRLCDILDRWSHWVKRGGLNKEDLEVLQSNLGEFCSAICIMGLLKTFSTQATSTLALDLRECIRTWQAIRLG